MKLEYKDTAGIDGHSVATLAGTLAPYIDTLRAKVHERTYAMEEAALTSPFDPDPVKWAEEAATYLGPVRHVVVVGIGGSSQGVEAVAGALRREHGPDLHVLDMLDHVRVRAVVDLLKELHVEDFAIVIISKSGSTTETLVNADVLVRALQSAFGSAANRRIVVVSESETPLARFAREQNMHTVEVPKEVGGRFSVFTSVGLVPLALLGYDVNAFVLGGASAIERELSVDGDAVRAAALLVLRAEQGDRMNVLFPEDPRLNGFVLWYEQLLAESLGKRTDRDGKEVFAGLVPIPMSPRELHSTAQLYLSHFPGIYTTFLRAEAELSALSLSEKGFASLLSLSGSRLYDRIPPSILEGVRRAYAAEGLPYVVYDLEELTIETLGAAMAEMMLAVIYAAHLWNINAFDQPNVELYKTETKRILNS